MVAGRPRVDADPLAPGSAPALVAWSRWRAIILKQPGVRAGLITVSARRARHHALTAGPARRWIALAGGKSARCFAIRLHGQPSGFSGDTGAAFLMLSCLGRGSGQRLVCRRTALVSFIVLPCCATRTIRANQRSAAHHARSAWRDHHGMVRGNIDCCKTIQHGAHYPASDPLQVHHHVSLAPLLPIMHGPARGRA